ncbi:CGNR zinc finger domain-containing protein [Kitasatospora sp. NPDC057738]|uniref:CGNR zinc finger domain-containing protein n=1 Tax=Kitasatospora sp. NPDC057738 TaxID=3346233 RepID=UPI0036BCE487
MATAAVGRPAAAAVRRRPRGRRTARRPAPVHRPPLPSTGCGWLFPDASGRRRWCSLATCGTRPAS